MARLVFQVAGAILIIAIGYFAFGFTLVHGWSTFFEMLFLTAFGVIVFMGFGFVVSGIANSESTIPPIANVITLPQFLLAGTFCIGGFLPFVVTTDLPYYAADLPERRFP